MALSNTFTATGVGTGQITVNKKLVNLSIVGLTAGSGTVQLQRQSVAGTWVIVRSVTVDTEEVIQSGQFDQPYRFECTGYVSGTFVCELGS